jgi:hypothetical protein
MFVFMADSANKANQDMVEDSSNFTIRLQGPSVNNAYGIYCRKIVGPITASPAPPGTTLSFAHASADIIPTETKDTTAKLSDTHPKTLFSFSDI